VVVDTAKDERIREQSRKIAALEQQVAQLTATLNSSRDSNAQIDALQSQLGTFRQENERLRAALAASTANVSDWERQLQNLRQNNQKLLAALQESSANVESWKLQLNLYEEQNTTLAKKLQELELVHQRFSAVLRE
jgi:chromosome segregation ATPase